MWKRMGWMILMSVEGGCRSWRASGTSLGGEGGLDPEKVKEARLEEVQFMDDMGFVGRGAVAEADMTEDHCTMLDTRYPQTASRTQSLEVRGTGSTGQH